MREREASSYRRTGCGSRPRTPASASGAPFCDIVERRYHLRGAADAAARLVARGPARTCAVHSPYRIRRECVRSRRLMRQAAGFRGIGRSRRASQRGRPRARAHRAIRSRYGRIEIGSDAYPQYPASLLCTVWRPIRESLPLAEPSAARDRTAHARPRFFRGHRRDRRARRARRNGLRRRHPQLRHRRAARPGAERVARAHPRSAGELGLRLSAGPVAREPRAGRHAEDRGRLRPRHRAGAARDRRTARRRPRSPTTSPAASSRWTAACARCPACSR